MEKVDTFLACAMELQVSPDRTVYELVQLGVGAMIVLVAEEFKA